MFNNKNQSNESPIKLARSFCFKEMSRDMVTLNRTQKSVKKNSKQQFMLNKTKQKSIPLFQKKLKARILQLLQGEDGNGGYRRSQKKFGSQSKYNRTYYYHKVINKSKLKQYIQNDEIEQKKLKKLCDSKLMIITPKIQNIKINKNFSTDNNYLTDSNIFVKMCSIPKRKIKLLQLSLIHSNSKNFKTQPSDKKLPSIFGTHHQHNLQPWDKQQEVVQFADF